MADKEGIRMHIPVASDGCDLMIYQSDEFLFHTGTTVLVGCNGAGKTTLLRRMRTALKADGAPCLLHEHMRARDEISARLQFSSHLTAEDYDAALAPNWQSEGEGHAQDLLTMVPSFGDFVMRNPSEHKERWLLLDGMESGMSIDMDDELTNLMDVIEGNIPAGIELYLIMATNSYEIAKGRDCIDVSTAEHVTFDDYETYAAFVRQSRKEKDARRKISDEEWDGGMSEDMPRVLR